MEKKMENPDEQIFTLDIDTELRFEVGAEAKIKMETGAGVSEAVTSQTVGEEIPLSLGIVQLAGTSTQSSTDGGSEHIDQSSFQGGEPPKKKRRKDVVFLTKTEEAEVVEWLHSNPCLYDKGCEEYRHKELRDRMWTEMAEKVGKTAEQLAQWYWTQRTLYGKLKLQKTGSGAAKLSDRKRWVLDNFKFLDAHIYRKKSTSSLFGSGTDVPQDTPDSDVTPSVSGLQTPPNVAVNLELKTPVNSQQPEQYGSTGGTQSSRALSTNLTEIMSQLTQNSASMHDVLLRIIDRLERLPKTPPAPLSGPVGPQKKSKREKWCDWLTDEILEIPEQNFGHFQNKVHALLNECKEPMPAPAAESTTTKQR